MGEENIDPLHQEVSKCLTRDVIAYSTERKNYQ